MPKAKVDVKLIEKPIRRLEIVAPDDVDEIVVNGDLVWARYDREEYKFIPPAMRKFVQEHNPSINMDDDDLAVEMILEGEEVGPRSSSRPSGLNGARWCLPSRPPGTSSGSRTRVAGTTTHARDWDQEKFLTCVKAIHAFNVFHDKLAEAHGVEW